MNLRGFIGLCHNLLYVLLHSSETKSLIFMVFEVKGDWRMERWVSSDSAYLSAEITR